MILGKIWCCYAWVYTEVSFQGYLKSNKESLYIKIVIFYHIILYISISIVVKVVYNTIEYIIFQYGSEPVIIQRFWSQTGIHIEEPFDIVCYKRIKYTYIYLPVDKDINKFSILGNIL